jgi:hypothetical protein
MSLVIFSRHNNLPEAAVTFSCLESGGFHPNFQNYNHANIAALYILAFGGIVVQLPEQEVEAAEKYLKIMRTIPLKEDEPIERSKRGMWKRSILFAGCGTFDLAFLILASVFLRPEIITIGISALAVWAVYNGYLYAIVWLFFPLMLLHAKHIALPKLRQRQNETAS